MEIKNKLIAISDRVVGALGYFNIYTQRRMEMDTNILISDINCISSSIYNGNYRAYKKCLENIRLDGQKYLEQMNDRMNDSAVWSEEYKNAILTFYEIGQKIHPDDFNEYDIKFINDKLEDIFVNLDRACSLTGHSFTYHENKQRTKINNVKINAEKGAIVQTGLGQSISNVNNGTMKSSWQDDIPKYIIVGVFIALVAMLIFWYFIQSR